MAELGAVFREKTHTNFVCEVQKYTKFVNLVELYFLHFPTLCIKAHKFNLFCDDLTSGEKITVEFYTKVLSNTQWIH